MDQLRPKDRRKFVFSLFRANPGKSLPELVELISSLGVPRATIYRLYRKFSDGCDENAKTGSGRKPSILNSRKKRQFLKCANNNIMSIRNLASKFNLSKSYAYDLLRKNGICYKKQVEIPKSDERLRARQQERLRILSENVIKKSGKKYIIEDDESYFPLRNSDRNGHHGLWTSDRASAPDNIKFRSRQKFPVKLCVWIAVSAKGPSEPYFVPAKTALDSDLYIKECLLKRLSPYISEKFDNKRYIFWPDGASAHYAQKTIQAYSDLSINYVRKADNPPNIPHLRVIEKFWAHLKHKVYENNWSTTTILALKRRIKVKIAEFDSAYWRRLFASTRSDIADADEHGVLYKFSRI